MRRQSLQRIKVQIRNTDLRMKIPNDQVTDLRGELGINRNQITHELRVPCILKVTIAEVCFTKLINARFTGRFLKNCTLRSG